MKKQFESEEAMAAHVVDWLTKDDWDVYQEVQIHRYGPRADIVAVRSGIIWIIESKLSFGFGVLGQAFNWRLRAHFISVAVPFSKSQDYGYSVARSEGIGVIWLKKNVDWVAIHEEVRPALNRKRLMIRETLTALNPQQKTAAKAGSRGGYYTPFRETCRKVLDTVTATPGITMKELLGKIETHYSSVSTARSTLAKRIEENLVPGVKVIREGRLIRLYPVGLGSSKS
jgi:hypothetical protein